MPSFEDQWNAAAYNAPYWAAYAMMLLVPAIAGVLIATCVRRRQSRLTLYSLTGFTCFFLTAELTVETIQLKWRLRREVAVSEPEMRLVAEQDGANLAFSPIIGGFYGCVAVAIETSAALVAGRLLRARAGSVNAESQADKLCDR